MGKATHDNLSRLQDLLAREIPDGDPAAIFDRALTLLLRDVEKMIRREAIYRIRYSPPGGCGGGRQRSVKLEPVGPIVVTRR